MDNFRKCTKAFVPKLARVSSRLLKDERGQSTTEYILILAVVVMMAMKFKSTFNGQLGSLLNTLSGQLTQAAQPDP